MIFFTIVGVATCVAISLLALVVLYWMFIHPAFQALSISRWLVACEKLADPGKKLTIKQKWGLFKWGYQIGGLEGRHSNRYGEWRGIGKWIVYDQNQNE